MEKEMPPMTGPEIVPSQNGRKATPLDSRNGDTLISIHESTPPKPRIVAPPLYHDPFGKNKSEVEIDRENR